MKLIDLFSILKSLNPEYSGDLGLLENDVERLSIDSREAAPGVVFVALKGVKRDGHEYVAQTLEAGGMAAVVDRQYAGPAPKQGLLVRVDSSREALPALAAYFNRRPTERMLCFGVTGTNGKTSTVYLLEHILNAASLRTGVLGTINHHFEDKVWPTQHTTPEPIALQARLQEMKTLGAEAVAMEVSSHALEQRRADGVLFNAVIFTNLTRDHLDYHGSEEEYFKAKERLFTDLLWASNKIPLFAIVNSDDPWGRRLRVASKAGIWTFGESKNADFRFRIKSSGFAGIDFSLDSPFGKLEGHSPLIGRYNLYNLVGAIAAVASAGVPPAESLRFVQDFKGVPGRLERVLDPEGGRNIFVDYAHTPDALENVLQTLVDIRQKSDSANTKSSRILTLFGCGGDRDKGKRPLMAAVAAKYSEACFVTSDNPRSEDPDQILNDIWTGFSQDTVHKAKRVLDREEAIRQILQEAKPGDVVLIAGKGHEDYQEIRGERHRFLDSEVANRYLGKEANNEGHYTRSN